MADQLPFMPNGIERIALSFSGGGFRAAAFSLGCVAYLQHLQYQNKSLLEKVDFISSASGGSITNLLLCDGLRRGDSFKTIYDKQLLLMTGCGLMDKVFALLTNDDYWQNRPEKSRNLINAFAAAYDSYFFDGATLSDLSKASPDGTFNIGETCINTTEFDNGMNFRFGTGGRIGNTYLRFKEDPQSSQTAGKIKLGDILACSSCFPAGFEPVMFPRDFTYQDLTARALNEAIFESNHYTHKETGRSAENQEVNFGFMDGGIDDNQGIYAYLLANSRVKGNYGLYFTCDVTSNFLGEPFSYPAISTEALLQQNLPQLVKKISSTISWYFICASLAFLIGLVLCFFAETRLPGLFLAGLTTSAIVLPALVVWKIRRSIAALLKKFLPADSQNSWLLIFNLYKDKLATLPLSHLLAMLLARASSVLLLAATIYLKKIRRISYDYLYARKAARLYRDSLNTSDKTSDSIISNLSVLDRNRVGVTTIYLLATKNDFMLQQILHNNNLKSQIVSPADSRLLCNVLQPSALLRSTADKATNMDTTLWFDPNQVKDATMEAIVATGQATMCFNLILMAYQFGNTDKEWGKLKADLLKDWEKFQTTPDWLY